MRSLSVIAAPDGFVKKAKSAVSEPAVFTKFVISIAARAIRRVPFAPVNTNPFVVSKRYACEPAEELELSTSNTACGDMFPPAFVVL